ncbi:MAG: DUF3089 domain-containing protein [Saprospiraceae bacterium]
MKLQNTVINIAFFIFSCVIISMISSCSNYKKIPIFDENNIPPSPDYSLLQTWAAHPYKLDPSDKKPGDTMVYNDSLADVDVFFLHPTSFTQQKKFNNCNADVNNQDLNRKTDRTSILFQASAFNNGTRVFAPRYRQAHFNNYFTEDKATAKKAFDLAYKDVLNAFEYYMQEYNEGRPFIIASHSQGTNHAIRLIKQVIDGKALQSKFIAGYLVGMPVTKDTFQFIKPCTTPDQVGCYTSWRTYKKGTEIDKEKGKSILVTNPISWSTNTDYVSKEKNKPSLLTDFDQIHPFLVDAQVNSTILWVNKPKFKNSIFLRTKNYHPADINFFYFSIQENIADRINNFELHFDNSTK